MFVIDGEGLSGFPGRTLMMPVRVRVLDASGKRVSGARVDFTSPTGGQTIPTQVTTGPLGEAQAIVVLPDIPHSQFSITARASTGGSATINLATGMKLLDVFGNAATQFCAASTDGSIYAGSRGSSWAGGEGGIAVYASDGTLRLRPGPALPQPSLPDGMLLANLDSSLFAISPDQKIYYSLGPMIFVFDANLVLLRIVQLQVPSGQPIGLLAADASGNIITSDGGANVDVYDAIGQHKAAFVAPRTIYGLGVQANGNVVVLSQVSSQTSAEGQFREYTQSGNLVRFQTIPQYVLSNLYQDSSRRNYFLNSTTVHVYDQNFQPVKQIALLDPQGQTSNYGPQVCGDSQENIFIPGYSGIEKHDSQGLFVWRTGAASGAIYGGYSPPIYVNALESTLEGGLAVDPRTGTVYIGEQGRILRFQNGSYQGRFSTNQLPPWTVGEGLAVNSRGEIYSTAISFGSTPSGLAVFDSSGAVLRSLPYTQFGHPTGIAIDANDQKWVIDIMTKEIHLIDASDQYVRSIPVSLPADLYPNAANLALSPDGTLVIFVSGPTTTSPPSVVRKLQLDGTEKWSKTISTQNFVLNIAVDNAGNIFVHRGGTFEMWDGNGTFGSKVQLSLGTSTSTFRSSMGASGSQVYFRFGGNIFVVSGQ